MTHHELDSFETADRLGGVAGGRSAPGLLRQIGNGFGGLLVLLLTGIVLIAAVLWTSR